MDTDQEREINGDEIQTVLAVLIVALAVALFVLLWWATPVGVTLGVVLSAIALGAGGLGAKHLLRRGQNEEML